MTKELLDEELKSVNDEIDELTSVPDKTQEEQSKLQKLRARRLDLMGRLNEYKEEMGTRQELEGM